MNYFKGGEGIFWIFQSELERERLVMNFLKIGIGLILKMVKWIGSKFDICEESGGEMEGRVRIEEKM